MVKLPRNTSREAIQCGACGAILGSRREILANTAQRTSDLLDRVGRTRKMRQPAPLGTAAHTIEEQSGVRDYIAANNLDAEVPKLLFKAYEHAYRLACHESPPPNEPEDLALKQQLASLVLNAYGEGENEPDMLKRIALVRLRRKD